MNIPDNRAVTTNDLRLGYENNDFSFGNPEAFVIVCLAGSCRIVPILNYFRAYNSLNGHPFELLCFNPVEMWKGPGTDIADCASERLKDYRFKHADVLICESLKHCGPLNTVPGQDQDMFKTLACAPEIILRIPNWHGMLFYDAEVESYNKAYAALPHEERISMLRTLAALYKTKFVNRCAASSFPDLVKWVGDNWLTTRMGWTSEHVCRDLSWKFFELVAGAMGIPITPELAAHPLCVADPYATTGPAVRGIDREANNWEY